MAYGTKYRITFRNEQEDEYRIDILEKDFVGNITSLAGAHHPFVQKYQLDERPPVPILASEAEINFWSSSLVNLESFYSEDDEQFRVDFYCDIANGVTLSKLLWSGFVVQDDCSEEFQDHPYVVTLNATDNLGLLKEVSYDSVQIADSLIAKNTLFDYIKLAIQSTGISLPFRVFANIYENTQQDRGDSATAEFLSETRLFSGMFVSEEGKWDNLYKILETIDFPLNMTLLQAEGYWNIVRYPEFRLFTDNAIAGTQYDSNFSNPIATALDPNFLVKFSVPGVPIDHEFIGADAIKKIVRPFKFNKYTFNYNQPKQLIYGSDLQKLGDFISTTTDGDLRYDDYEIPDQWKHTHNDNSFIRVVTDTSLEPESEVDRYVVTPGATNEQRGVEFNPIPVSKDDSMDFSLDFKMTEANGDTLRFWIRLILVTPNDQYYLLSDAIGAGEVKWTGPFDVAFWDDGLGFYYEVSASADKTAYINWNFNTIATGDPPPPQPVFPEDGILLIEVRGTNGSNSSNRQTTAWKNITLTITNRINETTNIIGQTHTTEQPKNIKNVFDEEIFTDDSPRNTIAGTLYTNDLTTFGADIGDIYFTKTALWHRKTNAESLRLGEITTEERKFMAYRSRPIVEGTFTRVRYDENKFISPLTIVQIESLPGSNFIMMPCEINYMENVCTATMWELYADDDSESDYVKTYTFKYLYKTS